MLHAIKQHSIKPTAVLEVGCADGWRLRELMKKYKCMARGIDPCHDLKPMTVTWLSMISLLVVH